MERLAGTSLDFLITAAISAVDLSALGDQLVPFLILCCTGFLWHFLVGLNVIIFF
jgi:ESS family glutamate:Na+ symporter